MGQLKSGKYICSGFGIQGNKTEYLKLNTKIYDKDKRTIDI